MKRKRLSEAMETLDFMQKPIELAQSSQPYLWSLWETAAEISKSYASITSIFSSIFTTLSNFLVQEAILNMAVYELALNRLMFFPDYRLAVSATVQPEQEYVQAEPMMPTAPVFNLQLVRKLVADFERRIAKQAPRPVIPTRAEAMEKVESETAEEPTEEHKGPELMGMPFQTVAEVRGQLESGLAPSTKNLASTLRAYSSYAVSLSPLPLFVGTVGLETLHQPTSIVSIEQEVPRAVPAKPLQTHAAEVPQRREEEGSKTPLSKSVSRENLAPEALSPGRQALELPTIISQRQAEVISTALSLPSRLSHVIEEVSPSLASWVYGESEALRSTGLSLSAVPVAASTAQRIVTEALIEPISGIEGSEMSEREVPFRFPSVFTSLVAAHARSYSPFYAEPSVGEVYAVPSRAETPYRRQGPKESVLSEEAGVSRLPSVIALAAAESLIAQKLQREMAAFAKDVQTARSTYQESPSATSNISLVRATKLGELAAVPSFPVPIEPYAPAVSSPSPPHTRPRLMDRAVQNTIDLTVSAETQEEDLRELERKINRILAEQLSRYYGSTRI